jgi:hypothetical protein
MTVLYHYYVEHYLLPEVQAYLIYTTFRKVIASRLQYIDCYYTDIFIILYKVNGCDWNIRGHLLNIRLVYNPSQRRE